MSARTFSRTLGVADNNTQNYVSTSKPAMPNADYLERMLHHFQSINPAWLLTGKGEPFLPDHSPTNHYETNSTDSSTKIFSTNQTGKNTGVVGQNTGINNQGGADSAADKLSQELALAQKENESLRRELQLTEALLAAKEETITLLRVSFNRPN